MGLKVTRIDSTSIKTLVLQGGNALHELVLQLEPSKKPGTNDACIAEAILALSQFTKDSTVPSFGYQMLCVRSTVTAQTSHETNLPRGFTQTASSQQYELD
jgi:hypothetical protein